MGLAALFYMSAGSAIEPLKPGKDDTIIVHADVAWEDPNESISYYRGNFQLRTPDWSVQAGEATVYGPLNNPDRVLLSGEPALIWISQPEKAKTVEGRGREIEYLLTVDAITLSGSAELRDGENTISSETIRYDVAADSFSAGEAGKVKVSITPDKD